MKRIIMTLALLATLAPAVGLAQDTGRGVEEQDSSRDDIDISEWMLIRGQLAPNPGDGPVSAHPNDVLPEDLIDEICSDADGTIIVFGDDGEIVDWDCDYS